MSVETCAIRVNNLLTNHQYPLVAEVDGKIVGELELILGFDSGILHDTAFIDVMVVHKQYRRRGVGRALLKKAKDIGLEKGCDTISVWPEKNAFQFYKKCGIEKEAYRVLLVNISLENSRFDKPTDEVAEVPCRFREIKEMTLVSPRILSSYAAWLKSYWKYALGPSETIFRGLLRDLNAAFVIRNLYHDLKEASLTLWVRDEESLSDFFSEIFAIAKSFGFRNVKLYIEKKMYEKLLKQYKHVVLSDEILLYERLKE